MSPIARGSAPRSASETPRCRKGCASSRSTGEPTLGGGELPPLIFTQRDDPPAAGAKVFVARRPATGAGSACHSPRGGRHREGAGGGRNRKTGHRGQKAGPSGSRVLPERAA